MPVSADSLHEISRGADLGGYPTRDCCSSSRLCMTASATASGGRPSAQRHRPPRLSRAACREDHRRRPPRARCASSVAVPSRCHPCAPARWKADLGEYLRRRDGPPDVCSIHARRHPVHPAQRISARSRRFARGGRREGGRDSAHGAPRYHRARHTFAPMRSRTIHPELMSTAGVRLP